MERKSGYYRTMFHVGRPAEIKRLITTSMWDLCNQSKRYFLSGSWIESWLDSLPENVTLVMPVVGHYTLEDHDASVVAFAIFGITHRRGIAGSVHQWHLFRTGQDDLDQIWVEDNHVVCDGGHIGSADKALWCSISNLGSRIEVYIKVTHDMPNLSAVWHVDIEEKERAPYFDNNSQAPLLKSGILRKIKTIEKLPLNIMISEALGEEAVSTLMASSVWHVDKWRNTSTPSGFANPHFVKFHQHLILSRSAESNDGPRVFKLEVGGHLAAVLYGFQQGDWFGFYCLCQAPQPDNKLRLGLYFHWLLQQQLANESVSVYDFMAGNDDYKLLLSNAERPSFKLRLFKSDAIERTEIAIKRVLKRMKSYFSKGDIHV